MSLVNRCDQCSKGIDYHEVYHVMIHGHHEVTCASCWLRGNYAGADAKWYRDAVMYQPESEFVRLRPCDKVDLNCDDFYDPTRN